MSENVVVRQKSSYETEILASDPEDQLAKNPIPVHSIFELSPYGLLLVSIGTCTSILLLSYAQNRQIDLEEVEIRLEYQRDFLIDCEDCENNPVYEEIILKDIELKGDLEESDRKRLIAVSHQCPVDRMVQDGIEINQVIRN